MPSNAVVGSTRRARRLSAIALIAAAAGATFAAATANGAELNANTGNFANVFSSAGAGDTVVLASGSYGRFIGAMKPGMVTVKPAPGASASMELSFRPASNITIDGLTLTEIEIGDSGSTNITVRNSDIPGQTTLRTGELRNANILFDHNAHHDFDACASCGEGRIWLPGRTNQPSGITIQNSEFRGGLSDGIQNGSRGTQILNNTFHDLKAGSPEGVHTDSIQLYGSADTLIKGNYFYNVPNAIMAPDGADHETIEDNVIAADPDGYPFAITLYSDNGSIVRHNTFADGACTFNLRCGIVRIGAKESCPHADECDPGVGTIVESNLFGELSNDGRASVARNTHNLFTGTASGQSSIRASAIFSGGPKPTSYGGYALAANSPGTGNASDGLDRGIRIGASPPAGASPSPTSALAAVRVLSSLRSVRDTGKVRVRIVTTKPGALVVSGTARPGKALSRFRKGHSRKAVKLRALGFGKAAAGSRTVRFRVGRNTRRHLGRSKDARLTVNVTIAGQTTSTKVSIKR